MIRAVVFDSDLPFLPAGSERTPLGADTSFVGLTLLRRMILMAWRAGATQVLVVAESPEARARWSQSEQRLPIPVTVVENGAEFAELEDADRVLVLSALVWTRGTLLERLLRVFEGQGNTVAIAEDARCRGPLAVSGEDLRAEFAGCGLWTEAVRELARKSAALRVPLGSDGYRHLDSRTAYQAAERDMYRGLTSVSDGYLDRVFNRHISGWFTRQVINLPITPNQITYFHFSLGMLAAWLLWMGSYWQCALGAVLLQLSVALDCSDGEVARLKYQFSKFGSWLDVATDNVVTVALFIAAARWAYLRYGLATGLTLGGLMVAGVVLCVLVIYSMARLQERHRPGEASSLAATNRLSNHNHQAVAASRQSLVDAVINEATSRDFTIIIVVCALLGRLDWVAWMAAIGSHLFWMVFAAIQLTMLRVPDAESR